MIKLILPLKKGTFVKVLQRVRLYHPPIDLLEELQQGSKESLERRSTQFSEVMSNIYIQGVWKRTGSGRLSMLDEWVANYITDSSVKDFELLDVGGSDGSTTIDTFNYLRNRVSGSLKAAILERQFRLIHYKYGFVSYYLTNGRQPFLMQIGPLGLLFEETKASEGVVVNPMVRLAIRIMNKLKIENKMTRLVDILFSNPRMIENPYISWLEADLLDFDQSLTDRFDLIRCCNVLNVGYFDNEQLLAAVSNLFQYLNPNGLLLVARTTGDSPPIHNASIWRKRGDRFEHVASLGSGSEINEIIARSRVIQGNIRPSR